MSILTAFLSGLIFGAGLVVSKMVQPAKVLGFLDIAGAWDPSLALVMVGAIIAAAGAFVIAKRRPKSALGLDTRLPENRRIDKRLVGGSIVFGIGWGLAGLCPGPALVDLGTGQAKAVAFFVALIVGMCFYEWAEIRKRRPG